MPCFTTRGLRTQNTIVTEITRDENTFKDKLVLGCSTKKGPEERNNNNIEIFGAKLHEVLIGTAIKWRDEDKKLENNTQKICEKSNGSDLSLSLYMGLLHIKYAHQEPKSNYLCLFFQRKR